MSLLVEGLQVLFWLMFLFLFAAALYPQMRKIAPAWAVPFSLNGGLLLFTAISWYCGLVHLPLHLALLPFIILVIWQAVTRQYSWRDHDIDLQFLVAGGAAFLLLLEFRFQTPMISTSEKFMDHAILASIIRTPVVPPLDPWFADGSMNIYYYLGHWMMGALGVVTGIPSTVVFNLILPTVFALTVINLLALGRLIVPRLPWLPLLLLALPDPDFLIRIVSGQELHHVFWESSRVISGTIDEYPLFSYLWGDAHAHVMAQFNQAFLLFLLAFCWYHWSTLSTRFRLLVCGLLTLSLGSMAPMNSWDILVYGPLMVGVGVLLALQNEEGTFREKIVHILRRGIPSPGPLVWLAVGVPVAAALLYLPFYLMMETAGTMGLFFIGGAAHPPSGVVQFLLFHGIFLGLLYLVLARDIQARPYLLLIVVPVAIAGYPAAAVALVLLIYLIARRTYEPAGVFAATGLLLVVLCEFVYLESTFTTTSSFRMNTVFKLYWAAWLLIGAGTLALAGTAIASRLSSPLISPARRRGVIAVVLMILLITPPVLGLDFDSHLFYQPHKGGVYTLDGSAYLAYDHPADAAAIAFLRNRTDIPSLIEAAKNEHSYYSRISSFTGIPTEVGWLFNEYLWRGNPDNWYFQRMGDIQKIYESPDETIPLMNQYGCQYLYVGPLEGDTYNLSLPNAGLTPVYAGNGVTIFSTKGSIITSTA
jgi:YYY domain-containing protein